MKINSLTILSSLGCNLNCKYCQLAASKNEESIQLQKNTIESLKNNEYLKNVKKVLLKLDQSPANIEYIALWGQEPTLTLQHITDNLENWISTFPYWDTFMFSTNGIDYQNRIIDFIKKIDQLIEHNFNLQIQFSYDGNYGTKQLRNANEELIYKNISNFINELNKIKLSNVNIRIFFHGVLSLELLKNLQTYEQVYNYNKNMIEWAYGLYKLNLNKNVFIDRNFGLGLENPVDATVEDGLNLYKFIKLSLKIDKTLFPLKENSFDMGETLINEYKNILNGFYNKIFNDFNINFDNIHQIMNEDFQKQKEIVEHLSRISWCSFCNNELKILYDGTLMPCQNQIFDKNKQFIKRNSLENNIKYSLANNNYFINPLVDDDEKINQLINMFSISKESNFAMYYQTTVNTMIWLLQAKQIDESYQNTKKLLKHAYIVSIINSCYYNSQIKTGSLYLKNAGFIRFLCNGFLDYLL